MLRKYSTVFNEELGTFKVIKAFIALKPDVTPKFYTQAPHICHEIERRESSKG